jgi:hypothetical protein
MMRLVMMLGPLKYLVPLSSLRAAVVGELGPAFTLSPTQWGRGGLTNNAKRPLI